MSLSPTTASALRKIAEVARSGAPGGNRLEQILGVAREALGVGSLSVVATGLGPGGPLSWHSSKKGAVVDCEEIEREALDFLSQTDRSIPYKHYVMPLPPVNGYRLAIVTHERPTDDVASALLELISSYISVLVENEGLSQSLESAREVERRNVEIIAGLYDIGQAVGEAGLDRLLNLIVNRAAAVMNAQACSIMLRNDYDGTFTIRSSYGLADDIVKGTRVALGEGIAGKVAETGKPMMVTDVSSDPRLKDHVQSIPGVSASICVPLKDQSGSIIGILSIRRHEPNPPFDENDLRLFSVFATHATLALSNANLCSDLQQRMQEMSTISDVLTAINSSLDLDDVLEQIVDNITQVVGFDRCCVYLLDSRSGEFVAGARRGYGEGDETQKRVGFDEGVIGIAAKEKIPVFSQASPSSCGKPGCEGGYLVAPIVVRDECIGAVIVDNCLSNKPIEPHDVEMLSTFVSQAGIAVENARLYEAMEEKYAELNILYEHSRNISGAYGLESVSEMLVQAASKAIKCDGAALLLMDSRRGQLKLQAHNGAIDRLVERINEAIKKTKCVEFVRSLRGPLLFAPDSPDRCSGDCRELLNLLAPGKSHLLIAPLVSEDACSGFLAMHRAAPNEFSSGEFKLSSIITSNAATVLRKAITYEQRMRQRVLELTALYEFSKRLSSAASLEDALDSILAVVADLVDYDEACIYAVDRERGTASPKAARARGGGEVKTAEEPLDGGSVTSWAIKERKALVFPDVVRDSRFGDNSDRTERVKSLMSIPLIVQDEVVGVLNVYSYSPNQYSEDDVRVISIIASQGAAIYKELEALSALTSYTDNILSSIAAGVVTLDSDGTVITWNKAAEQVVGLAAEEIVGLDYNQVLDRLSTSEEDKEVVRKAIKSVVETGETYQGYKLCFHPNNTEEMYLNLSISQLVNSNGEPLGVVIIFEDISREIKMENEFHRMGELAAVGQLAASIAHELRNPLSSIKGAAQYLQKECEDHGSVVEFLDIIIEEVNGLNRLTTEFLDFARPMQLELKPTSVNSVVEKTLQLMSVHITDSNVIVRESLDKSVPEILADDKQLEQVLKNMIINSLQAMPDGGVLSVETGPGPAGGVYLSVSDNGMGIPQDKLDRIFQPFFTTKTKGTGLGLSVVSKIIENHGGRIEVESEVGQGTTFKIMLPRAGAHLPPAPEIDQTMERRVSGRAGHSVLRK